MWQSNFQLYENNNYSIARAVAARVGGKVAKFAAASITPAWKIIYSSESQSKASLQVKDSDLEIRAAETRTKRETKSMDVKTIIDKAKKAKKAKKVS